MQPKVGMEDSGEGTQTDRRHLGKAVFVIYRGVSKDQPEKGSETATHVPVCISIQPFPASPLDQDYSEGRNPSVLLSVS